MLPFSDICELMITKQNLAQVTGGHREQARLMYVRLRKNLVKNVFQEWKKTGFAWEQYSADTGEGQRSQHFTGWTSLVVNIMAMPDLKSSPRWTHSEL